MTIPLNLQVWISSASLADRLGTTQLAQMMSCPQFWEANDLQPIERLSSYCSRVPPRFMAMIAPGVKPPGVPFPVPAQVWPLPPSYNNNNKPTHNHLPSKCAVYRFSTEYQIWKIHILLKLVSVFFYHFSYYAFERILRRVFFYILSFPPATLKKSTHIPIQF